jgi:hypothetical protein
VFVFNRPEHTQKCLESLKKCHLASKSELYIYCDGPRNDASEIEKAKILETRSIAKKQTWGKATFIIERDKNMGLADSVITGIKEVLEKHNEVIVVEDDLVVGEGFLNYMNRALRLYEKDERVMQVSGFIFDIDIKPENKAYLVPLTTTWGWATWKRVWEKVDFFPEDYLNLKKDKALRRRFNLGGAYNYSEMLITQMEGRKLSSWGIRFWWDIFKKKGLVVYPDKTLVLNNGFDNTGRHSGGINYLANNPRFDEKYEVFNFEEDENYTTLRKIINFKQEKTTSSIYKQFLYLIKSRFMFKD